LWEFSPYKNYRQLFKSPETDLCAMLTATNNLPILSKYLDTLREIYPLFPTKCPISPRAVFFLNVPIVSDYEGTVDDPKLGFMSFPNGLYRHRITINSVEDPVGGYIEWVLEVKRKGNPEFW
jgi:hypothetical protein